MEGVSNTSLSLPPFDLGVVSKEDAEKIVGEITLMSPLGVRKAISSRTPPTVEKGKRVLMEKGLNSALSPNSMAVIKRGVKRVGDLHTPERKRHGDAFKELVAGEPSSLFVSPEVVKRVNRYLKGPNQAVVQETVLQCNRYSPEENKRLMGVDTDHIIAGVDGGFHFCPKGDPKEVELTDVVENPNNCVRVAMRRGKFSTLFPSSVATEGDLVSSLVLPDWKAYKKGKSKNIQALCQIGDGKKTYYMMQHLTHGGALIRTAYPFFEVFEIETMEEEVSIDGAYRLKKREIIAFLQGEVPSKKINNRILLQDKSGKLFIRLDKCPGIILQKGVACFVMPATIGMS